MDNIDKKRIDLLELAKKLWNNRKFIIKSSVIGAIIGIMIAFSIPKEYTTTVVLTAELGKQSSGGMGALASMAGINLGVNSEDSPFSPQLYPDVLSSTPFIKGLLSIRVTDPNQKIDTTIYSYVKDMQKEAWWNYILKAPNLIISAWFSQDKKLEDIENKYSISKDEMDVIDFLRNSYSINTSKKNGVTTLDVTAQSPIISAFLADTLTSYLQSYIIHQRTKKATADLANLEVLYRQSQENYYKCQEKLASFTDINKNITLATYRINQEKLENEARIASAIYNQMAQQLQMAKIKVQNDTPIFIIIQPAVKPFNPSNVSKKTLVLGSCILFILGSCIILLRHDIWSIISNE